MSDTPSKSSYSYLSENTVLRRKAFYEGQDIITQGQEGVRAYFVESGRVGIFVEEKGHELKVAEVGEGEIFGEMALVSKDLRSASARALQNCTVQIIGAGELEKILDGLQERAVAKLVNTLVNRLRQATQGQVQHYIARADFEDKLMGIHDRVQMGVDKEKREAFRAETEPLIQKLQEVLDKYA